jgi:hypothetical protein
MRQAVGTSPHTQKVAEASATSHLVIPRTWPWVPEALDTYKATPRAVCCQAYTLTREVMVKLSGSA